MKANRLVLLAAAAASALALSACSSSAGGDVAATVDGTPISNSDVSFLAGQQCTTLARAAKDPAQASGAQAASRKQIRAGMLNALVQAQLNRELGEREHVSYDRATYREAMDQFEQTVRQTPKKDRSRFRELVGGLYQGQLEVYAIATRELAAQGIDKPTQDQLESTVTKLQDDFRASAKVKIDPIYGPDKSGVAGAADTSLSVPVSAFARGAAGSPENPTWVSALPANQKCG